MDDNGNPKPDWKKERQQKIEAFCKKYKTPEERIQTLASLSLKELEEMFSVDYYYKRELRKLGEKIFFTLEYPKLVKELQAIRRGN